MTGPEPRFARIAAMIGDPTRSRILALLLDGTLVTAGEIAHAVGVTPQTASVHLGKLVDAGLIAVRPQGRHRYFKLADGDIAHALESLAIVAEADRGSIRAQPHRGMWSRPDAQALRQARTCYGHLAGRLGVQLHDALLQQQVLVLDDERYALAPDGGHVLAQIGFDAAAIAGSARGLAYGCVDWSERRDHFAGPLAVALLDHFVDRRWLARIGATRALAVNGEGRRALAPLLGRAFAFG